MIYPVASEDVIVSCCNPHRCIQYYPIPIVMTCGVWVSFTAFLTLLTSRRTAFVLPSPYCGEINTPNIPWSEYAQSSSRLVWRVLAPKVHHGDSGKRFLSDAGYIAHLP